MTNSQICKWFYMEDEDYWETQCGEEYSIIEGNPKENRMKYCPFCGKKLKEGKRK